MRNNGRISAILSHETSLRISASKTTVLSTQPRSGAQHVITPGGVPLEEVESFKYLGPSFTATGQTKDKSVAGLAFRKAFSHG